MYTCMYKNIHKKYSTSCLSFFSVCLKVASGLPVNNHLWGAVDVCWKCSKIKSELLSGELDGVCMYIC